MEFQKEVLFLGLTANTLRDGGVYYTVQFYVPGGDPVSVNVMGNAQNEEILSLLRAMQFGDNAVVTFVLRPVDKKTYKLGLSHVS